MKLETTLKTLKTIKSFAPCGEGWKKLLKGLGQDLKNPDLDREVSLRFIFKNNGLDDALWALRCFPELEKAAKWYALYCAERVRHLMVDKRSTNALDVTRLYLLGSATKAELEEAAWEAWEAERAEWARSVAWTVAWAVEWAWAAEAVEISERKAQEEEFERMLGIVESGGEYRPVLSSET